MRLKPGEAKNSWLTGTAAWNWVAISQHILGIHPDYNGLRVDPCIPSGWDGYEVTRIFRGATYRITVRNPHHLYRGVQSLRVNGREVVGNLVPPAGAGEIVEVEAVLNSQTGE